MEPRRTLKAKVTTARARRSAVPSRRFHLARTTDYVPHKERKSAAAMGRLLEMLARLFGAIASRFPRREHVKDGHGPYGPYRLRERIGTGGMGEVYLAEHVLLKRPCAIKLIRPGRAAEPKVLARFEREVRATARLSHENTVTIHDYGRTGDGTLYYVMEYLPGLNFAELVERYGPLPPGRVIHLIRQACRALREAHDEGLIHRDIKPANLFAAKRGGRFDVTKLLDFGLVKPTSASPGLPVHHSRDGVISGSPLYMSPEQATGAVADLRSDLYALGAVAYFLLTGQPPFPGENAIKVMLAHMHDKVPAPSRFLPGIPEDLERVVLRCLAKGPADRFPDAEGLELALAACTDAGHWSFAHAARWWIDREGNNLLQ